MTTKLPTVSPVRTDASATVHCPTLVMNRKVCGIRINGTDYPITGGASDVASCFYDHKGNAASYYAGAVLSTLRAVPGLVKGKTYATTYRGDTYRFTVGLDGTVRAADADTARLAQDSVPQGSILALDALTADQRDAINKVLNPAPIAPESAKPDAKPAQGKGK